MKRLYLAILAPVALSGCTALTGEAGLAPAPLAATTADDKALETAWRSFDAALDAINLLGDAGIIQPGSPSGKAIAAGIRKVNSALVAAESFDAAASTTDYLVALAEAQEGLNEIRAALRSN